MSFTRWYDKDNHMKIIMDTLEQMDDKVKISVAMDLIQMIIQGKYPETDDFIEEVNTTYIPIRRRWYDKDETVHSAVEMLKYIDTDGKRELMKEILYSIIHFKDNQDMAKYEDEDEDTSWD